MFNFVSNTTPKIQYLEKLVEVKVFAANSRTTVDGGTTLLHKLVQLSNKMVLFLSWLII